MVSPTGLTVLPLDRIRVVRLQTIRGAAHSPGTDGIAPGPGGFNFNVQANNGCGGYCNPMGVNVITPGPEGLTSTPTTDDNHLSY